MTVDRRSSWLEQLVLCYMLISPFTYVLTPVHRPGRLRCRSYVGQGSYTSRLYESCLENVGKIAHELGHIIGFLHEHMRHDRHKYIQMNKENIIARSWIYDYEDVAANYTYVGTTYDPGSIMHYPPINYDTINHSIPAFTLLKNVRYSGEIGQRNCLSPSDVDATNRMYSCPKTCKYACWGC